MSYSNYLEDKILDHVFKGASFTPPSNLYIALFSSDPGETGVTGELSGNGYTRKLYNTWNTSVGGLKTNNGPIDFPEASGDWLTCTHFGIFDDITAGNFLGGGILTTPKTITAGDIAEFADTALHITQD
jgi:hypothetical protein